MVPILFLSRPRQQTVHHTHSETGSLMNFLTFTHSVQSDHTNGFITVHNSKGKKKKKKKKSLLIKFAS